MNFIIPYPNIYNTVHSVDITIPHVLLSSIVFLQLNRKGITTDDIICELYGSIEEMDYLFELMDYVKDPELIEIEVEGFINQLVKDFKYPDCLDRGNYFNGRGIREVRILDPNAIVIILEG